MKKHFLHNHEAEQSVLGAIFLRPSIFPDLPVITDDFTRPDHQSIYNAMLLLSGRGDPIDEYTVYLVSKENGGQLDLKFLYALSENVGTAANVDYYTKKIKEASQRRAMFDCSTQLSNALQEGRDPQEIIRQLNEFSFEDQASAVSMRDAVMPLGDFVAQEVAVSKTYIHPWLHENSIGQIAGPKGVGKTMFALSLAEAVARGADFGPWTAGESCNVLYLEGELVISDLMERAAYFKQKDYQSQFYILSGHKLNELGVSSPLLIDEKWQAEMTGTGDLSKRIKTVLINLSRSSAKE